MLQLLAHCHADKSFGVIKEGSFNTFQEQFRVKNVSLVKLLTLRSFLCLTVCLSLQAFENDGRRRAERLRMVFNFYTITLIAVVESGPVTERILSAILPVLCRGLKSELADYKEGSYGIVCKMLVKATLKTSLVETLMNTVCKVSVWHRFSPQFFCLFVLIPSLELLRYTQRRVRCCMCGRFPSCIGMHAYINVMPCLLPFWQLLLDCRDLLLPFLEDYR